MDIALYNRTSDWVEIVNVSKKNYPKTIKFLNDNRIHMDSVSFGYGPIPSLAIKYNRTEKFIDFAKKNGLIAEFDH